MSDSSGIAEKFTENRLQKLRENIALFSDAEVFEIALIPNTSFGFNSVLSNFRKKKKVLLYEKEYNGLTMPFDMLEWEVHTFSDSDGFHWDPEIVKKTLIEKKIELFVFSSIQWQTGYLCDVIDLCTFCRENKILTIIDVSQSMGSVKFSFKKSKADVAITSNYKWLNAGFGSGIMWMTKEMLEAYPPQMAGYNSAAPHFDFDDFRRSIRCFEPGHLNLHAFVLLDNSIKEKLDKGSIEIQEYNRSLTQHFIKCAKKINLEVIGGIAEQNRGSISVLRGNSELYSTIKKNGIMCSARGEGIRFGFHYHNTMSEVDKLLEVLSDLRNS